MLIHPSTILSTQIKTDQPPTPLLLEIAKTPSLLFLNLALPYLDPDSATARSPTIDEVNPARFFSTFSINASPALYELRTSGPLAQYRNPNSSARWRHRSNTAGGTYSCTFMWLLVGCIYCPKVTTSTLAVRSSRLRFNEVSGMVGQNEEEGRVVLNLSGFPIVGLRSRQARA